MSTHMPGFQSFSRFLHIFVLAKLASSSIEVEPYIVFQTLSFLAKGGSQPEVTTDVVGTPRTEVISTSNFHGLECSSMQAAWIDASAIQKGAPQISRFSKSPPPSLGSLAQFISVS